MLNQKNPKFFPDGPDYVISDEKFLDLPKVQIRYHAADEVNPQYLFGSGNLICLAVACIDIGYTHGVNLG